MRLVVIQTAMRGIGLGGVTATYVSKHIAGVLQPLMAMYEEVAPHSMQPSTGQAAAAPKAVALAVSPAPDVPQIPQQATQEQQQTWGKDRAQMSGHLPKQGSLPSTASQADLLSGQHLRAQPRAVAPSNMFMPASAAKLQRSVDLKPAARQASAQAAAQLSSDSLPGSYSSGLVPRVASAGLQQSRKGDSRHQQGQTHISELIESDIL